MSFEFYLPTPARHLSKMMYFINTSMDKKSKELLSETVNVICIWEFIFFCFLVGLFCNFFFGFSDFF